MGWNWECGEEPRVVPEQTVAEEKSSYSVAEAVSLAKLKISELPRLTVLGEVTGFHGPNARSGHCYFQLKDKSSAMDVTMWRGSFQRLSFDLRDGLQVEATGSFQVYDKKGSLSFNISSMKLAGEGALRQQVAELARKLQHEGLMDPARKRKIPLFCERVCVVTSLSGAVIDDVKRTLARRNPLVTIQAAGCTVQGPGAASTIIDALELAAAAHPDAILLVRGGGSFEDLMTFNDEALARAVAACPVPVITGIGHEPDTSICDMVSDRRCSTPTAAAESVAPAMNELETTLNGRQIRLGQSLSSMLIKSKQYILMLGDSSKLLIERELSKKAQEIEALAAHRCLHDPLAIVREPMESLELSAERLHDAMPRMMLALQGKTNDHKTRLDAIGQRLLRPYQQQLTHAAATLDALSPLRVLGRGYSLVQTCEGHVVTDAAQLKQGDRVTLRLRKGSACAQISNVSNESNLAFNTKGK
ncbi:exodeoxyribonuclease VII large subunit [uncultured Olegusella sp.]|uniref:exodeoxyribonuclease VII large subunit n=1 Tax=uncultured Olegusella sp. TaxID=1979846 RepID=UPI0026268A2A|nr:exodeoxyribonuclease VII large subunit [uncultured Olegusella sp.]